MNEYRGAVVVSPSPAETVPPLTSDERWAQWQAKGARHDDRVARNMPPGRGDHVDDRSDHLGFSGTALNDFVKGVCRGKPPSEAGLCDVNSRWAVHRGISVVARLQT